MRRALLLALLVLAPTAARAACTNSQGQVVGNASVPAYSGSATAPFIGCETNVNVAPLQDTDLNAAFAADRARLTALESGVAAGSQSAALTSASILTALGYAPLSVAAVGNTIAPLSGGMVPAGNLPIGTVAGMVAAGNDSRIVGALQQCADGTPSCLSVNPTGGGAAEPLSDFAAKTASATPILSGGKVPLSYLSTKTVDTLASAVAPSATDSVLVYQGNQAVTLMPLAAVASYVLAQQVQGTAAFVSVSTPAAVAANASVSVTGGYANVTPTSLDYQVLAQDGTVYSDWTTAVGVTFSAGTWSGLTITGLGQGFWQVRVRLENQASAQASTAFFSVGYGLMTTLPAPGQALYGVAGNTIAVSGVIGGFTSSNMKWQFAAQKPFTAQIYQLCGMSNGVFASCPLPIPAAAGTYQLELLDSAIHAYALVTLSVVPASTPVLSFVPPTTNTRTKANPQVQSGYYGGGALDALDYQWDVQTGPWLTDGTTALTPAIGAWTLTMPGADSASLAAGSHTLYVRWRSNPSVVLSIQGFAF